jgi:hypothetical protein
MWFIQGKARKGDSEEPRNRHRYRNRKSMLSMPKMNLSVNCNYYKNFFNYNYSAKKLFICFVGTTFSLCCQKILRVKGNMFVCFQKIPRERLECAFMLIGKRLGYGA